MGNYNLFFIYFMFIVNAHLSKLYISIVYTSCICIILITYVFSLDSLVYRYSINENINKEAIEGLLE